MDVMFERLETSRHDKIMNFWDYYISQSLRRDPEMSEPLLHVYFAGADRSKYGERHLIGCEIKYPY